MLIEGKAHRTIWVERGSVMIIDQTRLPHHLHIAALQSSKDAIMAIRSMMVRGAPLIGVTAAYGVALAMRSDASDLGLSMISDRLFAARPTAVNLGWALERMKKHLRGIPEKDRAFAAFALAAEMADEDVACNEAIGAHGLAVIEKIWRKRQDEGADRLNILTHCNAGWLATVDWGTALAPVYKAQQANIPVHVWVDETRPRNQGASLTARELSWAGVPHSVIVDNCGGHLMQKGRVDLCITGADRVALNGDSCNKIGTYLKALAAKDNGVPFYIAAPDSTIDKTLKDGKNIPIEEREETEVSHISGLTSDGEIVSVRLVPKGTHCVNIGFDVTPARLITGVITERGVVAASADGLASLYAKDMN